MKVRNFYPRQVLYRLRDRRVDALSSAERHALLFFTTRTHQYGYDLTILEDGVIRLLGGRGITVISGQLPAKATPAEGKKTILQVPAGTSSADLLALLTSMKVPASPHTFKPRYIAISDGQPVEANSGLVRQTLLLSGGPTVV